MVHRRLQEGLLRVNGSIEHYIRRGPTPILVTVGICEARQKQHKGPKVTTVLSVARRTALIPVTFGTLEM